MPKFPKITKKERLQYLRERANETNRQLLQRALIRSAFTILLLTLLGLLFNQIKVTTLPDFFARLAFLILLFVPLSYLINVYDRRLANKELEKTKNG